MREIRYVRKLSASAGLDRLKYVVRFVFKRFGLNEAAHNTSVFVCY